MKELITKINRERGYSYKIDKEGNVYKESYNWLSDPYTLVMIAVVVLSLAYYFQISAMMTSEKNFEQSCLLYMELRNDWMSANPGQLPTLKDIFEMKKEDVPYNLNLPNG